MTAARVIKVVMPPLHPGQQIVASAKWLISQERGRGDEGETTLRIVLEWSDNDSSEGD